MSPNTGVCKACGGQIVRKLVRRGPVELENYDWKWVHVQANLNTHEAVPRKDEGD